MAGSPDQIAGIHRGRQAVIDSVAVEGFERDAALERRGGRRPNPSTAAFTDPDAALRFLLRNVPGLKQELDDQDR